MILNFYLRFRGMLRLACKKSSFLQQIGWDKSVSEKKPMDAQGNIVPWMNYAVISILKERLNKDLNLFEYGSGYSTLFYCQYVKHVTSIEYDSKWFEKIKREVPANSDLKLIKNDRDGNYCRAISKADIEFDIVIIDGRDRVNCFKQSLSSLSDNGVIILDDSSRPRYSEAFVVAKNSGFKYLTIEGLKPTSAGLFKTTLFYRSNNCLNI